MHEAVGAAMAIGSGLGFPITQLAIRRFGRPGAVAVGLFTAGVLAHDVTRIATRIEAGSSTGKAVLYAETAAAALATVATLTLATEAGLEAATSRGWRVGPLELIRRTTLGMMFGMLAMRFKPYLRLDRPTP
jgi:hypothetical protein